MNVTMLNSMADRDFESALDLHKKNDVMYLDLKDCIYGKNLIELTEEESKRAKKAIDARNQSVYCLSSVLGAQTVSADYKIDTEKIIELAKVFCPSVVRLIACSIENRASVDNSVVYLKENYPFVFDEYKAAVKSINDAGYGVTIEGELGGSIFSNADEVLQFFDEIDNMATFTYDVQNLWQMGEYPSIEVQKKLRHITSYYHVKGGIEDTGGKLLYASILEDSTYPVREMLKEVECEFICLNWPHGKMKEGYDYDRLVWKDLQFVRRYL